VGPENQSNEREVVRVEEIVKDFRPGLGLRTKRVLRGISLAVDQGEIFGFVGPNGSGKTTTLKILMGLIRMSSGKASILGHDVGQTRSRRHVGFLPENPYFYDFLTGREILHFYAKLAGLPAARRASQVDKLLDWVSLSHAADARLRTYSKGMLQRVGIAQSLVHDPRVVFLDEPMSGLDPIGRKEIRDLILQLRSEGKTVFMNTHILSDVEALCDRVAIIVHGRIRYQGRVEDFLDGEKRMADILISQLSAEGASEISLRFGEETRGFGDQVEYRVPEKDVNDLLSTALRHGAQVHSVTPHRKSLEEIFLTAVEEGK
jgi:ABC-2 type transport system ATP-binding protein